MYVCIYIYIYIYIYKPQEQAGVDAAPGQAAVGLRDGAGHREEREGEEHPELRLAGAAQRTDAAVGGAGEDPGEERQGHPCRVATGGEPPGGPIVVMLLLVLVLLSINVFVISFAICVIILSIVCVFIGGHCDQRDAAERGQDRRDAGQR